MLSKVLAGWVAQHVTSGLSRYEFFGDEHGRLIVSEGSPRPALGTIIECVTPHCDPTVNLHDWYHVVRGDTLVDVWPVDARGRR